MIQYRVVLGRKNEIVDGPDDAEVVVTVGIADAGGDPSVAFMQGRLKSTGPTGVLFEAFGSGAAAAALHGLVERSLVD
jgi:hypothetical protein